MKACTPDIQHLQVPLARHHQLVSVGDKYELF